MRLVCPNCNAEYEVDPSVIPAKGRDVQCSTCSHTWFQPGADAAAPASAQPTIRQIDPKGAETPARPRRSRVERERATRAERAASGVDVEAEAPGPRPAPRREIDPSVLEVLRSEAEREERYRRGEPPEAIEEQTEFALAGAAPRQSRRVPTDPRDLPDEDLVPSGMMSRRRPARDGGGREALPDIEEINSSLRASSERAGSVPAYVEVEDRLRRVRRGQGFRMGFSIMLFALAGALFAYMFAPEITARWPDTAPYLETYVREVNILRGWLDTNVRDFSARIIALISENSG